MSAMALCIALALAATSLDNLGQGFQKAGSEWMAEGPPGLRKPRNLGFLAVWVLGILLCIAAPVTLAWALMYGPSSIVAGLGAFGLVPLYLFAGFVLKEPITRYHGVALAAILACTGWIGWRSSQQVYPEAVVDVQGLLLASAAAVIVPGGLAAVAALRRSPLLGLTLGCFSGALGGLVVVFFEQGASLNTWWASGAAGIAAMIVAFLLLQVAYRNASAVQIVPANTATALLVPIAVAPVAFDEPVQAWLLLGMGGILFGIAALAYGESRLLDQAPLEIVQEPQQLAG